MDKEIINVLEYLGEKFGIAIDWSSQNILPQVYEILGRYRIYQIFKNVFISILFLLIVVVCIKTFIYLTKEYKKKDSEKNEILFDYYGCISEVFSLLLVFSCVFFILFSGLFIFSVFETSEWIIIPEVKFLEILQQYIN